MQCEIVIFGAEFNFSISAFIFPIHIRNLPDLLGHLLDDRIIWGEAGSYPETVAVALWNVLPKEVYVLDILNAGLCDQCVLTKIGFLMYIIMHS